MNCNYCGEEILEGEEARQAGGLACEHFHEECMFRMIVGSVGHVRRKCECYGGNEDDPPGLSKRDAALEAVTMWKKLNTPGRL